MLLSACDKAAQDKLQALFYVAEKATHEMADDSAKWKKVIDHMLALGLHDFSAEFDKLMLTEGISKDILETCQKLRSPPIEETLKKANMLKLAGSDEVPNKLWLGGKFRLSPVLHSYMRQQNPDYV